MSLARLFLKKLKMIMANRPLIYSAVLHAIVLILVILTSGKETGGQQKEAVQVSVVDQAQKSAPKHINGRIAELTPSKVNKPKKERKFYYGLGLVSSPQEIQPRYYGGFVYSVGSFISDVAAGYNGEKAGLMVGDIILSVDGVPTDGWAVGVIGEGPTPVELVILRGNKILVVKTTRSKVYLD